MSQKEPFQRQQNFDLRNPNPIPEICNATFPSISGPIILIFVISFTFLLQCDGLTNSTSTSDFLAITIKNSYVWKSQSWIHQVAGLQNSCCGIYLVLKLSWVTTTQVWFWILKTTSTPILRSQMHKAANTYCPNLPTPKQRKKQVALNWTQNISSANCQFEKQNGTRNLANTYIPNLPTHKHGKCEVASKNTSVLSP